jgi:hypothetical protein
MLFDDVGHHFSTSFNVHTYHHHGVLVNGQTLVCNDSQIENCIKECAKQFLPIDQQACVNAVEAKWAPYSKCFTGESTVIIRGENSKRRLADLRVGEYVLDANMTFTKVVGWLHQDSALDCEFLRIEYGSGSIELTPDHLLFCPVSGKYIPANDAVSVEVPFIDGTLLVKHIQGKRRFNSCGIYAPLTTSGSLLVDGVHVSCYASPGPIPFTISQSSGNCALALFRKQILPSWLIDGYCKSLFHLLAF